MPSQKNLDQVKTLTDKVSRAKSLVIFNYADTSANEQVDLRRKVRQSGGEILITKNSLIDLAVGKGKLSDSLTGMNAILFAYEDEIEPIKALFQFHQEKEKLAIKQGIMADKIIDQAEIETLSQLPGRKELLATLINRLQSPGQGLVSVLSANARNLVSVLHNLSQK